MEKNCQICLQDVPIRKMILLSCSHIFCEDCLKQHCIEKINLHHVNETSLVCPEIKCGQPLLYYLIKRIIPEHLQEKYEKILTENVEIKKGEKILNCPSCGLMVIINELLSFVTCNCSKTWCTNENCMGNWEKHTSLTCQQFKEKYKDNLINQNIDEYIKEKKLQKCPVCGAVIEKTKNCNYIRCESKKCQKKTIFCYICGELLKDDAISVHYQGNNFFKPCREKNVENIINHENNEKINILDVKDGEIFQNNLKNTEENQNKLKIGEPNNTLMIKNNDEINNLSNNGTKIEDKKLNNEGLAGYQDNIFPNVSVENNKNLKDRNGLEKGGSSEHNNHVGSVFCCCCNLFRNFFGKGNSKNKYSKASSSTQS